MVRMCSMCYEVKDISEYKLKKDGEKQYYNHYCNKCQRIYNAEYMRAYREINTEYVKKNVEQQRIRNARKKVVND